VVETQGLNRWFVNACQASELHIIVANPAILNLKRSGKKTDRRDAYELARRLWLGHIEKHARTYYPADEEYGKRKVLRIRHKCVTLLHAPMVFIYLCLQLTKLSPSITLA
jgi:hypothetical protein